MRKLNLELPKYRLQLHFKFVRRRKPLISEPILPTVKEVNKKYRSGTFLGKIVRHWGDIKGARKIFAGNLAAIAIATTFFPAARVNAFSQSDGTIIEVKNPITTQKGIQQPLERYEITQGFSILHPGVDLRADIGDPIKTVKAGRVTEAGYSLDGYGNTLVIDHGRGLTSRYAHLSTIKVKVGEEITANTEIGQVGITGRTTGPHLHLEIRQNGLALNPLSYLSQ